MRCAVLSTIQQNLSMDRHMNKVVEGHDLQSLHSDASDVNDRIQYEEECLKGTLWKIFNTICTLYSW